MAHLFISVPMIVRGVILRMMRFCMVMRVIMSCGSMLMRVRMNNDLAGSIATAAILRADLPCPPAFGTIFLVLIHDCLFHGSLLSRFGVQSMRYGFRHLNDRLPPVIRPWRIDSISTVNGMYLKGMFRAVPIPVEAGTISFANISGAFSAKCLQAQTHLSISARPSRIGLPISNAIRLAKLAFSDSRITEASRNSLARSAISVRRH